MENLDPQAYNLAKAIKRTETGSSSDPYNTKGASGEFGAYQFMPKTYKNLAKQHLGDENAQPTIENQNKIAYSEIKRLKDAGNTPAQIASIWNSGKADAYKQNKVGVNSQGVQYNVPDYVAKVSKNYNELRGSQGQQLATQIQSQEQPVQQPQEQGGAPFKYNPADNPLIAGLKTAGNLPYSGVEFAKGAVESLNPLTSIRNYSESLDEMSKLKELQGGTLGAIKATAKEIPRVTYETLVPEGIRNLLSGLISGGNLQDATKQFVENPVGNVAPVVLAAQAGFKGLDKSATRSALAKDATAKPVTKYSDAFDTGVQKTAGLVTKPLGGVINKATDIAKSSATYGISKFTGLDPQTIQQVLKNPEEFTKIAREETSRGGLANEVKNAIDTRIKDLSETGKGYDTVKNLNDVATASFKSDAQGIRPLFLDDALVKNGLELKNGKISATTNSVTRNTADINALNKFYKDWGTKKTFTANEFLNMRSDLAELAKYDRLTGTGKTSAIENIAADMRASANNNLRSQFKGLKELDELYAPETQFLKQVKKDFVNSDGTLKDNAPSKIANSPNKAELTKRLENIMPGITKKIEILKAVEDIERSTGIKVGTYGTTLPGAIGYVLSGFTGLIISQIIATPENAVRIIRSAGKLDRSTIKPIIEALRLLSGNINTTGGMIAQKSPLTTGLINKNTEINTR